MFFSKGLSFFPKPLSFFHKYKAFWLIYYKVLKIRMSFKISVTSITNVWPEKPLSFLGLSFALQFVPYLLFCTLECKLLKSWIKSGICPSSLVWPFDKNWWVLVLYEHASYLTKRSLLLTELLHAFFALFKLYKLSPENI